MVSVSLPKLRLHQTVPILGCGVNAEQGPCALHKRDGGFKYIRLIYVSAM
jgi:hypothetical protein